MSFRLNPRNFCMADAMPFQQHHEARVFGRDLNDVLTDEFFVDVQSNIQVGDQIVVCGYSDHTQKRLVQIATLRVFNMEPKAIEFVKLGEVVEIPLREGDPAPEVPESRLEVVRGLRCFNVIDPKRNGAVLESFKTKKEAEDWAAVHSLAA